MFSFCLSDLPGDPRFEGPWACPTLGQNSVPCTEQFQVVLLISVTPSASKCLAPSQEVFGLQKYLLSTY